jgi:hypothetical protein
MCTSSSLATLPVAAAETANARVEVADAEFECREHVGEPGAAGVVEVQVERHVGVRGPELPDEAGHPRRRRHPGRVAEGDGVGAVAYGAGRHGQHPLDRHVAFVGAAPRGRDDDLHRASGLVHQRQQRRDVVE